MSTVIVSAAHIRTTLQHLHAAGKKRSECVVLWLGRRLDEVTVVETVWLPKQVAGAAFFEIPTQAMTELFTELRRSRCMIAAQVHSHPKEAFHSAADDTWAIVRHEGALSLVLPHFALRTTETSFLDHLATFQLTSTDQWVEIPKPEIGRHLLIK